jgi:glutaredoxin domain-containing cysteine-rich protein 1
LKFALDANQGIYTGLIAILNVTYRILFQAYVEREKGRVVLYMTSLGIVRETFTNCMKMKQILWTNMVKYEEADLFRDTDLQSELRDRTDSEIVTLPQLFVDGQHIGVCMQVFQ